MELNGKEELKGPVLHIVVVGFHHKKGCQVEYSYPPLIPEEGHDSNNLPEEWKYLPFLALPDGAHNYQEDTVFFHLPPLAGADVKCVYGVSCYRQIEAKSLKVRLADVTRETVQKSVCVLSQVPLYGLLQAKLQLIKKRTTFEDLRSGSDGSPKDGERSRRGGKTFEQIRYCKELYEHMNSSLRGTALEGSQVFLGMSPRDLILHFRHKRTVAQRTVAQRTGSPENRSPTSGSPENSSPENSSPENRNPTSGSPENSSPENSSPENSSPENSSPENSSPTSGSPENSSPENSSPENSSPTSCSPGPCDVESYRSDMMYAVFLPLGMIEHGLADSSHYRPKSSVSEEITLGHCVSGAEDLVSVTDITNATVELMGEEGFGEDHTTSTVKASQRTSPSPETSTPARENTQLKPPSRTSPETSTPARENTQLKPPSRSSPDSSESDWETLDPSVLEEGTRDSETGSSGGLETGIPITVQPRGLSAGPGGQGAVSQGLVSGLEEDQYGLPLAIFTKVPNSTQILSAYT
nr:late secretory pathway protein AVL9 homolog [Oncorhynchus nerka]